LLWSFCAFYKYDELKPNIMYEKLTMVATMLFILSMISERVVTFFKLWCVEGNSFLFFIVPKALDTSKKYEDATLENKRQRAILSINLTISFFIALISNASLFKMFTYDSETDVNFLLGWDFASLDLHAFGSMLVGCALTACFISLGSKFWHDMLDMLFYAKNLKEKLVDKATYEATSLKNLEQYLETNSYELAKIALEQNKIFIDSLSGIVNCYVGFSSDSKPVIILNSTLPFGGSYPHSLNGKLNYGQPFTVRTEIIYSYEIPKLHLNSGDNVYEQNNAYVNGTICCAVSKNNTEYLLTCAHVLTGGISQVTNTDSEGWLLNPTEKDIYSNDSNENAIGSWKYGEINNLFDAALIEIDLEIGAITNPVHSFESYPEEQLHKKVFVNGDINKSEGYVIGYQKQKIDFHYNGNTHQLKELIIISKNTIGNLKSLTEGGDSGALVYLTQEKKALGMVVGGNSQYTYAIPIERILSRTKTILT
jgi:hypothetical protein